MARASDEPINESTGVAVELLLEVTLRRGQLRKALAESLRRAIQDGRLAPGLRLPASRRLAVDLGVSRGVVTDVYDQLASEGYLAMRTRSAPSVAQVQRVQPEPVEATVHAWRIDFGAVTPEVALFPRRAWMRAVEHALRHAPHSSLDYSDHRGRIELRSALAAYLARARAVRVHPGRIIVTQGFTQALDLLCHVLNARGTSTLAMESPSHPGLWTTVRGSGLTLVGCAVDASGLRVEDLAELDAGAVVVAPAHQFPTGAVMTRERRIALVQWAALRRGLVIEDDYDAEFRYDRTPFGSVQGLDPDRVAHVGSASKTLAPGVRLGWISCPADLMEELRARKSASDSGSPVIDQLALAHLLNSGEYEQHVVRARQMYRRRRDLLGEALREQLPHFEIEGAAAGMQLVLRLPDGVEDVAISQAAAESRINVRALSPHHLVSGPRRGLLLGFGRLNEAQIKDAVAGLKAVLLTVL
jgi:GntR family transcriptional regulator/MocR family aminotransferase